MSHGTFLFIYYLFVMSILMFCLPKMVLRYSVCRGLFEQEQNPLSLMHYTDDANALALQLMFSLQEAKRGVPCLASKYSNICKQFFITLGLCTHGALN